MRMLVHVANPTLPESGVEVWYDSADPEKSVKDLGYWWQHHICLYPGLMRIGEETTDGIYTYTVLQVVSPRFTVGEAYARRHIRSDGQDDPHDGFVTVRAVHRTGRTFRVTFEWENATYSLSEIELLKFLTKRVRLAQLESLKHVLLS